MSAEHQDTAATEPEVDPAHAGGLDSKDSRSHANTVAAEIAREKEEKKAEEDADEVRPTDIAKSVRTIHPFIDTDHLPRKNIFLCPRLHRLTCTTITARQQALARCCYRSADRGRGAR